VDEVEQETSPAFYARGRGGWRAWWTLLHPPYTAWHLALVVIGASLAPHPSVGRLVATLAAFFLAVGIAAHALDEWNGRPLRTTVPAAALVGAAATALAGAAALGIAGTTEVGWTLVPFLVAGPVVVVAYNLEMFGGALHNDVTFAAAWGAFPVLTAYVAQAEGLDVEAVLAAAGAFALAWAQRALSTPARALRRRVREVEGTMTLPGGERVPLGRADLLAPLERALRALSYAVVLLAAGLAVSRFG
jgi:hypothetical protein